MDIGIKQNKRVQLNPKMANRHGLITGATGTGKTVTLKVLAENFSDIGVPVFIEDIKGDLSGFVEAGAPSDKLNSRLSLIGLDPNSVDFKLYPTAFWDIFGEKGHPLRATISDMGPLMLSKLLDLNDVQNSILYSIFKYADENGLLLLDFKDLTEMINFFISPTKAVSPEYRSINKASLGAIHRKLIVLERDGIEQFFGEPAMDIKDFIKVNEKGQGVINILSSEKLVQSPRLYSTFLIWLLSELFEELEEVGDSDQPRLVFFFDEAHLIFKDMPKYLSEKFEQVIKLIRSKGVGVYFVSQEPSDIPEGVLSQLGNRIQHALRAYTPKEQKSVKSAAEAFRPSPNFDTEAVISELGVGEALISFLDENGVPEIVERAFILPPKSKIGTLSDESLILKLINQSSLENKYRDPIDRYSAYEILNEYKDENADEEKVMPSKKQSKKKSRKSDSALQKFLKSTASSMGTQIGRSLARGLLGSLKKK